jgi:hypothetical protein
LLLALINKFFEMWQETLWKWWVFAFKNVWNVFRISYNYSSLSIILSTTFWIFLKKAKIRKNKWLRVLVWFLYGTSCITWAHTQQNPIR